MRTWQSSSDIPQSWSSCVAVIGVFDGIHKGHLSVIQCAVIEAKELGLPTVLITFDPHPRTVLSKNHGPNILTDINYRAELAAEYGIDYCYIIQFTPELAALSPEKFVTDILVEQLHVRHVIVGDNFRFGAKAAGDATLLAQLGVNYGFSVESLDLVGTEKTVYSATYIRQLITSGQVDKAHDFLGRPYRLDGVVERGFARGRELGFPTANIAVASNRVIPEDGVYAGWFTVLSELRQTEDGDFPPAPITSANLIVPLKRYPCAISIGTNPTFSMDEPQRTVETYVINASGDLYNLHVAVDFIAKVRGQRKFDSIDDLIASMKNDVKTSEEILSLSL